jgi:hypothetical protein
MSVQPSTSSIKHGCSAESRSTSAGSRKSDNVLQPDAEYEKSSSSLNTMLPEYDYPVPVIVRNTFIDTQDARSTSLEEFFEERRIRSCPIAVPENQDDLDTEDAEMPLLQVSLAAGAHAVMSKFAAVAGFWGATPTDSEYDAPCQQESSFNLPADMPRVLMLSQALPEPALGSPDVPTVGSVSHHTGDCKPCAFLYTKGCQSGVQCTFCHICPPDEKRRRQKEKHAAFREMRKQRRQVRL